MTAYSEDAPEVTDKTDVQELIDYARSRIENPVEIDGTTVYHFSSHQPDHEALEEAVKGKLRRDTYVVPIQVYSAWTFIMTILPETVREAELLIYRQNKGEYYAYHNFNRDISHESGQAIRQEFAEEIRKDG